MIPPILSGIPSLTKKPASPSRPQVGQPRVPKVDSISLRFGSQSLPDERAESVQKFLKAAETGDAKTMEGMLASGKVHVDAQDEGGDSALSWAISNGNLNLLRFLLKAGANPNLSDQDGWTPLYFAAALNGKADMVKALLDAGAVPTLRNGDNRTPLHEAVRYNNVEAVQAMLKTTVNPDVPDRDGWTPLHVAASDGKTNMIQLLLKAGADPMRENNRGKTPLAFALRYKYPDAARMILQSPQFLQKRSPQVRFETLTAQVLKSLED